MIVSTVTKYTSIISLVHIMMIHGFRRCYVVQAWTVSNHEVSMSKRCKLVQEKCEFTPLYNDRHHHIVVVTYCDYIVQKGRK